MSPALKCNIASAPQPLLTLEHTQEHTHTHTHTNAGVTLRENNLKEIQGGDIMESQGILVASKKALLGRPGLLQVCGCGLHLMRVGVSGAWCLLAACVVLVLDLRYLCFELFQDTRFGVCCAVM
jgi:hypothetical protein